MESEKLLTGHVQHSDVPPTLSVGASVAAHTPTPWDYTEHPSYGGLRIHGEPDGDVNDDGRPIDCTDYIADMVDTPREYANAARIVACVNACEGFDDPAKLVADHAALRASNAELVAALRGAADALDTFSDEAVCDHSVGVCWCDYNRIREAARDALARSAKP